MLLHAGESEGPPPHPRNNVDWNQKTAYWYQTTLSYYSYYYYLLYFEFIHSFLPFLGTMSSNSIVLSSGGPP